jgi:hypothetical protein
MSSQINANANANTNAKLKLGFLSPISSEWFRLYSDKVEMAINEEEAQYIIYESNGDPINIIMKIKEKYPNNKLVFILSGDQNVHIDNECIWFTNAIKPSGLCLKQTQIFVSNPAIFKFYEEHKSFINFESGGNCTKAREYNIYFKGTIWKGMRTDMYNYFKDNNKHKEGCNIIENNKYWDWRLNAFDIPTQNQLENTAYDSYNDILNSKLCLCPKGNGNSSMRIIEALACGSIPILINDFSLPFGISWSEFGLSFDTSKHTWEYIYSKCNELLNDNDKMQKLQGKGLEYFKSTIYGDSLLPKFKMYNDLNTVCFGFSNKIINKLFDYAQSNDVFVL